MEQDTTVACQHEGDAVKWNPYNRVVQCHRCGEQFPALTEQYQREATRRILFSDEYRLDFADEPKKRKRRKKVDMLTETTGMTADERRTSRSEV